MIEIAARSIGGLCSRTLRFGTGLSLEELILRQALGMEIRSLGLGGAAWRRARRHRPHHAQAAS